MNGQRKPGAAPPTAFEGASRLDLSGIVDVSTAGELQRRALAQFRHGADVMVGLEGVEAIDTAALQVLLALRAGLEADGRRLRLVGAREDLRSTLEVAGLGDALGGAS